MSWLLPMMELTIKTAHGTYISADTEGDVFLSSSLGEWELWKPYPVNLKAGAMCLKSHLIRFLRLDANGWGWTTSPNCLDQELLKSEYDQRAIHR